MIDTKTTCGNTGKFILIVLTSLAFRFSLMELALRVRGGAATEAIAVYS